MRFIFEVETGINKITNIQTVARLRKMMSTFEVMVNTTLPEIRVHLKEE